MSCERYERDLALAVEGDLPAGDVGALERHVAGCAHCQDFERELRTSQELLKSLTDAPLPEPALAAARARVLSAVATPAPLGWSTTFWAWSAAAITLVSLGLGVVWQARRTTPVSQPVIAQVNAPASPARALTPPAHSTQTARPVVSPHVKPARRSRIAPMSPEEADQLARALVAISRLQRLDGEPAEETDRAEAATQPLTRIASDDPNVVIYWQFESNGG